MKHLLILISLLLLSSPVIGDNHKGKTLYGWGECSVFRESCDYKWMEFGDKETHSVYQGQVKDGKPWNGTQYYKDINMLGKYVNGNYRPITLL